MSATTKVRVTVCRIETYNTTVEVDDPDSIIEIEDAAIRQIKTDPNAVPDRTEYEVTDEMGERL